MAITRKIRYGFFFLGKEFFMGKNLVPVASWEQRQPHFKRPTLYKWMHTQKFPGLFVKFSGRLFVDLDVFDKIIEQGRQK